MGAQGNQITWQFMVLLAGLVGGFVTGSIWLGANTNQIAVNTKRLDRIESFIDDVRQHDANTTVRLLGIERRLDQLDQRTKP